MVLRNVFLGEYFQHKNKPNFHWQFSLCNILEITKCIKYSCSGLIIAMSSGWGNLFLSKYLHGSCSISSSPGVTVPFCWKCFVLIQTICSLFAFTYKIMSYDINLTEGKMFDLPKKKACVNMQCSKTNTNDKNIKNTIGIPFTNFKLVTSRDKKLMSCDRNTSGHR